MYLARRYFHRTFLNQKDYYKILGIPKNAKENEVKKAYYQVIFLNFLRYKKIVFLNNFYF